MKTEFLALKNIVNEEELVQSKISAANRELEKAENNVEQYKQVEKKERKDVEKMNTISFNNAFYSLIGKKDKKLQKEQVELQVAVTRLQQAKELLVEKIKRRDELQTDLQKIEDAKIKYDAILSLKEKELVNKGVEAIINLNCSIDTSQKELHSLEDIFANILNIEKQIKKTLTILEEADDLGDLDIVTDSVAISILKQEELEDGIHELKKLKTMLFQLKKLMDTLNISKEDMGNIPNIEFNNNDFLMALDVFLDNPITDWQVQNYIENYINSTKKVRHSIFTLKHSINNKHSELQTEQQTYKKNKTNILEYHILS